VLVVCQSPISRRYAAVPVVVTLTVILASGSQVILAVNATGVAQLGYTSVLRIGEIHGVLVMDMFS